MPSPEETQSQVDAAVEMFDGLCESLIAGEVYEAVGSDDLYESALLSLAAVVNTAKYQAVSLMLVHMPKPDQPQIGHDSFIRPHKKEDDDK